MEKIIQFDPMLIFLSGNRLLRIKKQIEDYVWMLCLRVVNFY